VSSSTSPVFHTRDGKNSRGGYIGRDKHSLVSGKHSLAKGDIATSLIYSTAAAMAIIAVWLVGKWLRDGPIITTEQTTILQQLVLILAQHTRFETYLGLRVGVRRSRRIPLPR
jgi:hypothetical protein